MTLSNIYRTFSCHVLPLGALVEEILLTGAEAAGLEDDPELVPREICGAEGNEMERSDPPRDAVTANPREPAAAPRKVYIYR